MAAAHGSACSANGDPSSGTSTLRIRIGGEADARRLAVGFEPGPFIASPPRRVCPTVANHRQAHTTLSRGIRQCNADSDHIGERRQAHLTPKEFQLLEHFLLYPSR